MFLPNILTRQRSFASSRIIAKIAPPLLIGIGVAVFLALKEIFSGENSENKPKTASTNAETETVPIMPVLIVDMIRR
jgi:hypothetical protein